MLKCISIIALLCGLGAVAHAQIPTSKDETQAVVAKVTDNARGKRDDARTLRALSDERLAAKDYNGAMDARWQILGIGNENSPIGALVFYAVQPLALQDIAPIASHLDAASARRYATQLEQRDAKLSTYKQILTDQKADALKQVDQYFKTPQEWQKVIDDPGFSEPEKAVMHQTSMAQVKANIEKVYAEAIQRSQQPYKFFIVETPVDPYTRYIAAPSELGRFLWTRTKTQRLLVVAALRARADRLEKKTASAPLPLDPFGVGPLNRKGAVIYSVGPDATNDNGASVANPITFQPTDKGDLLAPIF